MELKCLAAALIGGSIVYFVLHGACNIKIWLKKKKVDIDNREVL